MTDSKNSEIEPLTRTQILTVMAVTAVILLIVAKLWQKIAAVTLLHWEINSQAILWGMAISLVIMSASGIVYRLWPDYRRSADMYLELIIKPLAWPDLIWLGLLPSFRGLRAIEQALASGVKITGCTVHLVSLEVDSGEILLQAAVPVLEGDTPESLHARIQIQEHKILPQAIALAAKRNEHY